MGIYGSAPPPAGYHQGDTGPDQRVIDDSAVEVALEVGSETRATVVAATVARGGDGAPESAPVLARLPDGRHMALAAADDDTLAAMGETDVAAVVGRSVVVPPGPARYRLATG